MIRLVVIDRVERTRQVLEFESDDITFGRTDNNDVVLPRSNVSKRHTRLVRKDGRMVVVDLNSTNGTFVDGKRLGGPTVLKAGERIYLGDFMVEVEMGGLDPGSGVRPPPQRPEAPAAPVAPPPPKPAELSQPKRRPPKELTADQKRRKELSAIMHMAHERLVDAMDLRRLDISKLEDAELRDRTTERIHEILNAMDHAGELPEWVDYDQMVVDLLNEALGLGPLEYFLADDDISEIMVNHAEQIYLELGGKLVRSEKTFSSNRAVLGVIERIVAPLGRRIDESSPMVDARLPDGSRVNAIIPPLALKGPSITIRKFKRDALQVSDLVRYGSVTRGMAEFLEMCVKAHRNVVISGGTGSGKTTLLNIMSSFIPDGERIVTVEDAAELQLVQDHVISLESRPPNIEGTGAITIRDLVRNSLRMRPDRIVVGECRGGEALDMLQAMNTGHDGSLTTIHANTPRDATSRMETLVLMAGMDLPVRAIREQIASAIHIVVQQSRFPDGSRKVTNIAEVTGMEVDVITMQDIFYFRQEGFDENGKVTGRYVPSGFIPRFYDDLQRRGLPVNMDIFRE